MLRFVKRLAANELGLTKGHQRGGVLIPRNCINFFPTLKGEINPESPIIVSFPTEPETAVLGAFKLRAVYYNQGTRDEYRLTPLPLSFRADPGDLFVMGKADDGESFQAVVVRKHDRGFESLDKILGLSSGEVIDDSRPFSELKGEADNASFDPDASQGDIESLDLKKKIESSSPAHLLSVTFDDCDFTNEEKALCLELVSEIYLGFGGVGLKIVENHSHFPVSVPVEV